DSAIRGNIEQRDSAGCLKDEALTTQKIHGIDAALEAGMRGREPNLVSVRGPCQSFLTFPAGGQNFLATRKIDDGHAAAVVRVHSVVEKCDLVALGRYPDVADPTSRFIQNTAQGKFQTLFAGHRTHNGKRLAIRRPIGPINMLGDLAWRPPAHRNLPKSASHSQKEAMVDVL